MKIKIITVLILLSISTASISAEYQMRSEIQGLKSSSQTETLPDGEDGDNGEEEVIDLSFSKSAEIYVAGRPAGQISFNYNDLTKQLTVNFDGNAARETVINFSNGYSITLPSYTAISEQFSYEVRSGSLIVTSIAAGRAGKFDYNGEMFTDLSL